MSSKKIINVQNKDNEFWPLFKKLVAERIGKKATDGAIATYMGWNSSQKVLRYRDGTNTPSSTTLDGIRDRLGIPGAVITALARACDRDIERKKEIRKALHEYEYVEIPDTDINYAPFSDLADQQLINKGVVMGEDIEVEFKLLIEGIINLGRKTNLDTTEWEPLLEKAYTLKSECVPQKGSRDSTLKKNQKIK